MSVVQAVGNNIPMCIHCNSLQRRFLNQNLYSARYGTLTLTNTTNSIRTSHLNNFSGYPSPFSFSICIYRKPIYESTVLIAQVQFLLIFPNAAWTVKVKALISSKSSDRFEIICRSEMPANQSVWQSVKGQTEMIG